MAATLSDIDHLRTGNPSRDCRDFNGSRTLLSICGCHGFPHVGIFLCGRIDQNLLAEPLLSRAAHHLFDDLDARRSAIQPGLEPAEIEGANDSILAGLPVKGSASY